MIQGDTCAYTNEWKYTGSRLTQVDDSECNIPCKDDSTRTCGGDQRKDMHNYLFSKLGRTSVYETDSKRFAKEVGKCQRARKDDYKSIAAVGMCTAPLLLAKGVTVDECTQLVKE